MNTAIAPHLGDFSKYSDIFNHHGDPRCWHCKGRRCLGARWTTPGVRCNHIAAGFHIIKVQSMSLAAITAFKAVML
jgi:hypothetical protein